VIFLFLLHSASNTLRSFVDKQPPLLLWQIIFLLNCSAKVGMLRLRSINCFSFASTDYLTALPSHKLFLKFALAETVLKFLCQHPAVTFFAYAKKQIFNTKNTTEKFF